MQYIIGVLTKGGEQYAFSAKNRDSLALLVFDYLENSEMCVSYIVQEFNGIEYHKIKYNHIGFGKCPKWDFELQYHKA